MYTSVRVVEVTKIDGSKYFDLQESHTDTVKFLAWAYPLIYKIGWRDVHSAVVARTTGPNGLDTNLRTIEEALIRKEALETMLNPTYHY